MSENVYVWTVPDKIDIFLHIYTLQIESFDTLIYDARIWIYKF